MYKWILSILIIVLLGITTFLLTQKTGGQISIIEKENEPEIEVPDIDVEVIKPSLQVETYTILNGDTLSSIAEKYGISVSTIEWNNNLNSTSLKVGDLLRIPPADGLLLIVEEGDTLESLSNEYSVSSQAIADYNWLDIPYTLEIGKEIFIPNAKKPKELKVEEPVVEEENIPKTNWWSYPSDILQTTKSGDDLLVLVNKKYKLPSTYAPSDLVSLSSIGIRTKGEITVRSIVLSDLEDLMTAASVEGINLSVVSGYRSFATQQSTYNYWVQYNGGDVDAADTVSARPGHSQHQLGTAVDFSSSEIGDRLGTEFNNTVAAQWLAQNSYRYGFVISFPQGHEISTGYAYESWHFRYIGVENAALWKQSGLILEEWLQQSNP